MEVLSLESHPTKKVKKVLGVVSSVSVESKNMFTDMGAGVKSSIGGAILKYEDMILKGLVNSTVSIEGAAKRLGANGILGLRITTSNTSKPGICEIIMFGTAVVFE